MQGSNPKPTIYALFKLYGNKKSTNINEKEAGIGHILKTLEWNRAAVVVVKWSAYLPSTLMMQVQILLKSTIFCKIVFEKNKREQKGRDWPI